jgi:hypothetical protein
MGHPAIENQTPFAVEPLFVLDEAGCPVVVPVIKATYEIRDGGALALAHPQRPVNLTGERSGPEATASWTYEPEIAVSKVATDVVLVGSAHATSAVTRELDVTLRVGTLFKTVHVLGERTWVKRLGGSIIMTDPQPFERVSLVWENAFGGWDRTDPDPSKHTFEPRNPVGTGHCSIRASVKEGSRLPNLEDPQRRLTTPGDTPPPAGFGFVSSDWLPRRLLAGTYDEAWTRSRMPLLPTDFDPRFYNAAAPGLVAGGHLRGDEPVSVLNASPRAELSFRLPGIPPPTCRVVLRRGDARTFQTRLDTVIVDLHAGVLVLLWRGPSPVPAEPQDVIAVRVRGERIPVGIR